MEAFATIGDSLRDIGTVCAAIAALLGLIALIAKLPPVRWVFRHLVSDPLSQWFRQQVREEMERTNGGSTLMDRVAKVEGSVDRIETALGIHEPGQNSA